MNGVPRAQIIAAWRAFVATGGFFDVASIYIDEELVVRRRDAAAHRKPRNMCPRPLTRVWVRRDDDDAF